ncbi:hypothetical protein ACFL2V_16175, partial [Pseudomonadota bacterium]
LRTTCISFFTPVSIQENCLLLFKTPTRLSEYNSYNRRYLQLADYRLFFGACSSTSLTMVHLPITS